MPYTRAEEIAWASGLYEGEGCCWMRPQSGYKPGYVVGVSVTSTDLDVLRRFRDAVGVGYIHGPKNPGNRPGTRPVYQWMAQSLVDVQAVLLMFRPLLGERRAEKADEVLALSRPSRPRPSLKAVV